MSARPRLSAVQITAAMLCFASTAAAAPAIAMGSPQMGSASVTPVPTGFAANSMTWLSPSAGWILGSAKSGSETKTDVVSTVDGGTKWDLVGSITAPIARVATKGTGVTELRFATAKIGYAFAPDLYVTRNGGTTFSAVPLPDGGKQVLALAASAEDLYVVVSPCAWSTGVCSQEPLRLWRMSVSSKSTWTQLPVNLPANDVADLSLHGNSVYVVDAQRNVNGKPDMFYASTDGRHFASRPVPCDSSPDIALLEVVATSATGVDLLCDGNPGLGKAVKFVYRSSDNGKTDVSAGTMGDSWGIQAEMTVSPTGNIAVASWSIASFMWINDSQKTTWSMVIGWSDGGRGWNDPTYVNGTDAWVVYSPVELAQGLGKVYETVNAGKSWHLVTL